MIVRQDHTDGPPRQPWKHRMWTDVNLPAMSPGFGDAFSREPKGALKADVLRVWLLAEYGGIYLDADFQTIGGIGVYDDIDWDGIEGCFWFHRHADPTWGKCEVRKERGARECVACEGVSRVCARVSFCAEARRSAINSTCHRYCHKNTRSSRVSHARTHGLSLAERVRQPRKSRR